jgi:hypothetical protein
MAIRIPVRIASYTETGVADVRRTFTCPMDVEHLTFKLWTESTVLNAGSVDVYVQTSDDGGTTWYDCGHFAQITTAEVTKANALWMSIPISGTSVCHASYGYTGAATALATTASRTTGLPVLGQLVGIYLDYATAATNGGVHIDVFASQSGRH